MQEHSTTRIARAGMISFAGSVVGAGLGFVLTLVLARSFGSAGAGVVLQAIALFTIGLSVGRGGLDTAATWIVPRLLLSDREELGGTVRHTVLLSLGGGLVAALVTTAIARLVFDAEVFDAVVASSWAMPLAAVTLVGTAALRALGGISAYILIVQVLVPALRVAFILLVAALGFGATTGGFAWALPYALAAVLTLAILSRTLPRQFEVRLRDHVGADTRRQVHRYTLGRSAGTILEQGLLYLDVLIVGAIVGTTAAGIYGTASRFVAAGLIVDTALRFVMAPIFSALLFEDRRSDVQDLYVRSTIWLVLLSVPIYLGLAVYAPVVLEWLGSGFAEGQLAMQILCIGSALTLTAGNIHTMLLMAGRSGQAAVNKLVVLVTNVALNLALVPFWGIEAAAAAWAVSMLLDALLAMWLVHRATGVGPRPGPIGYALVVTLLTVGVPAMVWRILAGATGLSMLGAALTALVLLGSWIYLDRRRLHMGELIDPIRARFTG